MSCGRAVRVVATGAGVVSPLGAEPEALFAALCRGACGLGPFAGAPGALAEASEPLDGLAGRPVGEIHGFAAETFLGEGNLRPLDRTGRLAAAAAGLALADAGWERERREREEAGLVLGTTFGSIRTIAEFDRRAQTAGPNYAKPLDFANSVINAAAGQTAIWHGLPGINSTISGGPAAGLQAIAYAAGQIACGRVTALLAGGADELSSEALLGFARAGLAAGAGGRPVPFDRGRDGFAPGEGAALLMLEPEAAAKARGARILGEVAGTGSAFDPSRGRDSESASSALVRAIAAALDQAAASPAEIGCVVASASGSVEGDRREAVAIARALGGRAGEVPVSSVKGALGEALGASGAFQALVALSALAQGRLPGVVGFAEPEAGFPLAVAADCRPVAGAYALTTALDFDGAACAVLWARK